MSFADLQSPRDSTEATRRLTARRYLRGLAVSGLFHLGSLAAIASWAPGLVTPPEIAGQRNVVSITIAGSQASAYSPASVHADLPAVDLPPLDAAVRVTPRAATIGKRRFSHESTRVELPPAPIEHRAEMAPLRKATLVDARDDHSDDEQFGDSSSPQIATAAGGASRQVSRPPSLGAVPVTASASSRGTVGSLGSLGSAQAVGTSDALPPESLRNFPPIYPDEAARRKLEGKVVLRILVTSSGKVGDLEVFRTSGHAVLDAAAVQAVKAWHYHPARRGQAAIDYVMRVEVVFTTK